MGKCVRIRGSSKPPPPPATEAAATAASCLTLRSGRRVLAASSACSPRTSGRPRRHRGSALRRWCGAAEAATVNKKRACGSPRRSGAAEAGGSPPAGRVLGAQRLSDSGHGRPEAKVPLSSQAADTGADEVASGVDHGRGDSFDGRPKTPPMSEESDAAAVKAKAKHENQSHRCRGVVTSSQKSSPSRLPPTEAEIETFFAAAELAERRRFAEAYNYDVALDRPLEGRFQWSPVNR